MRHHGKRCKKAWWRYVKVEPSKISFKIATCSRTAADRQRAFRQRSKSENGEAWFLEVWSLLPLQSLSWWLNFQLVPVVVPWIWVSVWIIAQNDRRRKSLLALQPIYIFHLL